MTKLSKRQEAILDFIKERVSEKGYPPSVREIAEAVGLASSSTVHGHLARLESKGYIRRDPTKPRAIEVLDLSDESHIPREEARYAPVIGKVTAGLPITAVENIEQFVPLPGSISGGTEEKLFVLIIEGESMIEAGILDEDMVIVRQQSTAQNGDIVVAMTDEDEATVKRFFKEQDHIRLQPENATMDPLIYPNVTILGKVVGLYRNID
ncbi:transcriptional repressor LexA [Lentibacillus cibarius]|uniref:LexA repressor n=1 Tax=Lentibacillus cibarius TaxID=2583219 RepID=A0A549YKS2_9BACI|nr:transcriptional repressor LexA [Lentibacillus cibarius]TRM12479.1 transcriptional repressor LexA [Lentibacillus cibarius]